jgi:uncharacterized protein YbjT (DUF2867 family)
MILVVGATGALGGLITRRLLDTGHSVRVLVRTFADYEIFHDLGAEPVFGDLKDRDSLHRACTGVRGLITTANSSLRSAPDTIETVDLQGNANLIDAARMAGVSRFVFTSALGASLDSPVPFMAAKAETEERLRESGLTWTVLAPEPFMEVWLGTVVAGPAIKGDHVVYVGSGTRRHSFVSVADVARFAVAALDSPAGENRYLAIGGPAPISLRNAVPAFERALGRPDLQRGIAPGEPFPGMPALVVGLLTMLDSYDSEVDMYEASATFGVTPTSLERYVDSMVPALAVYWASW